MNWAETILDQIKDMIVAEKDTFLEGTVESLNPLQVKPEGSSVGLKGSTGTLTL